MKGVKIGEKEYQLNFPSNRRAIQLGKIVGIDPMRDGVGKVDWVSILTDEKKTLEVLQVIFSTHVEDNILDNMTAGDLTALVASFFLAAGASVRMTDSDGANFLESLQKEMAKSQSPLSVTPPSA